MQRLCAAGLWLTTAAAAWAEPVEVSFRPPADLAEVPVLWEALPIDMAVSKQEAQLIGSGEPVLGPWTVTLEQGTWQVNGWTDAEMLVGTFQILAAGDSFEVAVQPPVPPPPYRCAEPEGCLFTDPEVQIEFRLPQGWAADQPTHLDLGGGTFAEEVTMIFFEDVAAEGGEAWFLNPMDWSDSFGPCRDSALGNLCTFSVNPASEAAYAIIAPSLRSLAGDAKAAP